MKNVLTAVIWLATNAVTNNEVVPNLDLPGCYTFIGMPHRIMLV
jgi:hypothetical protein